MTQTTAAPTQAEERPALTGSSSLPARRRYLHRRNQRRHRLPGRGITAVWVALVALVSWVFVVFFATLAH